MKWIGIIGMVVILTAAYLFSTQRSAIRLRVVLWGLALQILFAAIVLSDTSLSWLGMFIFFLLIQFYLFNDLFIPVTFQWKRLYPLLILLLLSILLAGSSYFCDGIGITTFILFSSLLGTIVCLFIKKVQLTRYFFAAALQIALGLMIHRGISGKQIFAYLGEQVEKLLRLSDLGAVFLFGNLAKQEFFGQFGFQFAFAVLPTIIFFSALISVAYYYGIMQWLVVTMAKFMRWTMGTSGAETLSCTANIFVGQTEAPLLIRPFLNEMTRSELHAVMVGGFGTIAGGVMAGYMRMGINASYLISASVMAAPASLLMAKLFLPETQPSKTAGDVTLPDVGRAENLLDAIARGVTDGLKLAVNVGAMLIAFIALIGFVDVILAFGDRMVDGRLLGGKVNPLNGEFTGIFPGSLKTLLGTIFAPLAFLMGVSWHEAAKVGNLIGIKISVNEFIAYAELAKHISSNDLSQKAQVIATYALCGFANFGSIGIQIGGIGALAPNRRSDLTKIAFRAMIAGALVSCLTATIAGLLL